MQSFEEHIRMFDKQRTVNWYEVGRSLYIVQRN